MESSSLRELTLELINKYRSFSFANATCSIPYFNNKYGGRRAALKVEAGKGSPDEILDEVKQTIIRERIDKEFFTNETLKKFLVEQNIGIDCSGFAYYVLNEEGKSRGKGDMKEHLNFPFNIGIFGKIKAKLRAVENAGVRTFSHNINSHVVELLDVKVGDFVSMIGTEEGAMRDHILIVSKVDYDNLIPRVIHYVHSIAWPTDGEYGTGFHEGRIEIKDINKKILEQIWIENNETDDNNFTFYKAKKSLVELRRLNWF